MRRTAVVLAFAAIVAASLAVPAPDAVERVVTPAVRAQPPTCGGDGDGTPGTGTYYYECPDTGTDAPPDEEADPPRSSSPPSAAPATRSAQVAPPPPREATPPEQAPPRRERSTAPRATREPGPSVRTPSPPPAPSSVPVSPPVEAPMPVYCVTGPSSTYGTCPAPSAEPARTWEPPSWFPWRTLTSKEMSDCVGGFLGLDVLEVWYLTLDRRWGEATVEFGRYLVGRISVEADAALKLERCYSAFADA